MKKFLMLLTSFTLLISLVLTGCDCSCSSTPALSFKNAFFGGKPPQTGYTETLTYSAKYVGENTDYPDLTKSSITDGILKKEGINYNDSSLITTFKVGDRNSIPAGVASEIIDTEQIKEVYVFSTLLSINATYNFENEETPTSVTDTITTEVYFLPSGMSFAPIYSTYKADMHSFALGATSHLLHVQYDYKTVYNLEEYTTTKIVKNFNSKGEEIASETTELTEEYDYKSTIDNNQLLFALRNYETNEEQAKTIEVLSPTYDESTSLTLSAHTAKNVAIEFIEGVGAEETLPVRTFNMNVNDTNASGANHYFTVQTGATNSVASKALLVKYAQPLFDYSSMSCMGALEFNLVSISHSA